MDFLPAGSHYAGQEVHGPYISEALRVFFSDSPAAVGQLLAKNPDLLKTFFKGNPTRIRAWFGHFSIKGISHFKYGSIALAQFAILNRDSAWQHLRWSGRHSHSPTVVVAKPHCFCELDVCATVEQLIQHCPHFWTSFTFANSVLDGSILAADVEGWAQLLSCGMTADVHNALRDMFNRLSWRVLCVRLLPFLTQEADLLHFSWNCLDNSKASRAQKSVTPGAYLVFSKVHWTCLEDLLLASACGCAGSQLLRMLQDDDLSSWVHGIATAFTKLSTPRVHWELRRQYKSEKNATDKLRWLLLLQAFSVRCVIHYLVTARRLELLETLFERSGLPWKLVHNKIVDEYGEQEHRKKKRRRSRHSSRRRRSRTESESDEEWGKEMRDPWLDVWELNQQRRSTRELVDEVVLDAQSHYVDWLEFAMELR